MSAVIDSSVAASWGIPDENSPAALRALTLVANGEMIVPTLFWHELKNVFLMNEKRNRLTIVETDRAIKLVKAINPLVADDPDHSAILDLARRRSLTAYDAAYLELALRLSLPLATLDAKLAAATIAEGVELIS